MNITIWIFLRIHFYEPNNADDIIKDCPFFEVTQVDFFACEIPIFFILILNTFFLIWIMVVSFSKLLILCARKLFSDCYFKVEREGCHGSRQEALQGSQGESQLISYFPSYTTFEGLHLLKSESVLLNN